MAKLSQTLTDWLSSLPTVELERVAGGTWSAPDIATMAKPVTKPIQDAAKRLLGKAYKPVTGVAKFGADVASYVPATVLKAAYNVGQISGRNLQEDIAGGLKGTSPVKAIKRNLELGMTALPAGVAIVGGGLAGKATGGMKVATAAQRILKGAATGGIAGGLIGGTGEASEATLKNLPVIEAAKRTLGGVAKGAASGAVMGGLFAGAGEVGRKLTSMKRDAEYNQLVKLNQQMDALEKKYENKEMPQAAWENYYNLKEKMSKLLKGGSVSTERMVWESGKAPKLNSEGKVIEDWKSGIPKGVEAPDSEWNQNVKNINIKLQKGIPLTVAENELLKVQTYRANAVKNMTGEEGSFTPFGDLKQARAEAKAARDDSFRKTLKITQMENQRTRDLERINSEAQVRESDLKPSERPSVNVPGQVKGQQPIPGTGAEEGSFKPFGDLTPKVKSVASDFHSWAQDAVAEAENNLAFSNPKASMAEVKASVASMFRDYLHDKGLSSKEMEPLVKSGLQYIEWKPNAQFVRPGFAKGTPYEGMPLGTARTLAGGKPANWTNPEEGAIQPFNDVAAKNVIDEKINHLEYIMEEGQQSPVTLRFYRLLKQGGNVVANIKSELQQLDDQYNEGESTPRTRLLMRDLESLLRDIANRSQQGASSLPGGVGRAIADTAALAGLPVLAAGAAKVGKKIGQVFNRPTTTTGSVGAR